MAQSNMEMDSIPCCMICLDSPKNAVICRHCSQPFCSSCIDVIWNHFSYRLIYTFCTMITFRNSLHKIPTSLDYQVVHIVGKLN
jgi:hypothetical protein